MTRTSLSRGFTIIELLVGIALGSLALGIITATFLGQQRSFQALEQTRGANEATRDVTLELQTNLLHLGWGIDPRFAIDERIYSCATPGTCRDSATGPDQIVFVARNANYTWTDNGVAGCATAGGCFAGNSWPVEAVTNCAGTTCQEAQITLRAGDVLHKGRVVLFMCATGVRGTMATVRTRADAPGSQTIVLDPVVVGNPYKANVLNSGCHAAPGAGMFLVDRFRYFVRNYGAEPWLVLDRGLDLNNNTTLPENDADLADLIPIGRFVDDMQVSWIMNQGAGAGPDATNTNWVVGDAPTAQEELNPTLLAPLYETATTDPSRFNLHPANARGVRVSISVRSALPDRAQATTWPGDPISASENRPAITSGLGRYHRYNATISSGLRNQDTRSAFLF